MDIVHFTPITIITGRNEVVAKVIFLHLFVILFTGGICLSACWDPPQEQTPPREQIPPRSRPPRADTTPPEQADPRPGKQTPAYGLRAAGTHPTGMHSCLNVFYIFVYGNEPVHKS